MPFGPTWPLRVILSAETRQAFLASVPDTSRARTLVVDAVEMPGSNTVPSAWLVTCDFESFVSLLSVAAQRCPDAVPPIVDAVNRAR